MSDQTSGPVVVVDRDLCMGSGLCVMYAPATFAHDAETKAIVLNPPGDPIEQIRVAVEACPMAAIRLENDPSQAHEEGA